MASVLQTLSSKEDAQFLQKRDLCQKTDGSDFLSPFSKKRCFFRKMLFPKNHVFAYTPPHATELEWLAGFSHR